MFTFEQKLNYITTQISCCEEGLISAVICPYCCAINEKGQQLCCDMFSKSAQAIIALQSTHPLAAHATIDTRHELAIQRSVSIVASLGDCS